MSYPNLLPRNVTKNRNPKRFPHKLNDLHKHKSRVETTTLQTLKIGLHQTSRPIISLTRINTIPTRVNPKEVYLLTQDDPKGLLHQKTNPRANPKEDKP